MKSAALPNKWASIIYLCLSSGLVAKRPPALPKNGRLTVGNDNCLPTIYYRQNAKMVTLTGKAVLNTCLKVRNDVTSIMARASIGDLLTITIDYIKERENKIKICRENRGRRNRENVQNTPLAGGKVARSPIWPFLRFGVLG